MLDFVHDRRGTSTNVLLHPYLQDVRSSSFTASVLHMLLACYTTFLASLASWITSVAVTHLQSLTTGLYPGTQQLTYFRRLSTSYLFALNSLCNNSKIRPFLRSNKVLLGRFFFLTLDGWKQSVSVSLHISLNVYRPFFVVIL